MHAARTAALVAAALLVPVPATAAATPAISGMRAAPAEQPVEFQVRRGDTSAVLSFSGHLSWSGTGNRTYTLKGRLTARCRTATRFTARLQYGGTSEKWKDSPESQCSHSRTGYNVIALAGTLPRNSSLRLRLGAWKSAAWVYSGRKTYAPPA
ncbi:hypothetical protein [Streptomyces sp. NPDC060198]|uniref:hypothetical protein n=1 Tax=Streptomyces sp. NPDC060198 TaxID=3347070 RepID=UPI003664DAC1